jgi:hypothetical protein
MCFFVSLHSGLVTPSSTRWFSTRKTQADFKGCAELRWTHPISIAISEVRLSGCIHLNNRRPNQQLNGLGLVPIDLPVFGIFEPVVQVGDVLHTLGHWPHNGSQAVTGKSGSDLNVEQGRAAVRPASGMPSLSADFALELTAIVHINPTEAPH